jgi:peptide/nickel transport system substrate-binding protein
MNKAISLRAKLNLFLAGATMLLGITVPIVTAHASGFSWTVNVASITSSKPNYFYPYITPAKFTSSNGSIQVGMYRPLYWYGDKTGGVNVDPALSLAELPVMSDGNKTATITMKKNYTWSNGAPVQAKDVMEFLNIMAADPGTYGNYAGTANGVPITIPDILASVEIPQPNTIVMHFVSKVDPAWLLYNPLSEVTPLPQAWDLIPANWDATMPFTARTLASANGGNIATKTAGCWSGKFIGAGTASGPTSTYVDQSGYNTIIPAGNIPMARTCAEVRNTMNALAYDPIHIGNMDTTVGKVWSIVNGPWQIGSWNYATGAYTQVRNPKYAGPRSATSPTTINAIPCQLSTGDCLNLLLSGQVDIGGVPTSSAPAITKLSDASKAKIPGMASGYHLIAKYSWAIGYGYFNADSVQTGAQNDPTNGAGDNTPRGKLMQQQYIRQALNDTYPGDAIAKQIYRGYAYPTPGPLPPFPAGKYSSKLTKSTNNPKEIPSLMTSHGWSLDSHGIWSCNTAAKCGAGIAVGTKFIIKADTTTVGDTQGQAAVDLWKSATKASGIEVVLNNQTFNTTIGNDTLGTTNWDMIAGASGWVFWPGFIPTGEPLWLTGAASNAGDFSDPAIDKAILGTINGTVTLAAYEKALIKAAGAFWGQWSVGLVEISNHIGGYVPQAIPVGTSELWTYKK